MKIIIENKTHFFLQSEKEETDNNCTVGDITVDCFRKLDLIDKFTFLISCLTAGWKLTEKKFYQEFYENVFCGLKKVNALNLKECTDPNLVFNHLTIASSLEKITAQEFKNFENLLNNDVDIKLKETQKILYQFLTPTETNIILLKLKNFLTEKDPNYFKNNEKELNNTKSMEVKEEYKKEEYKIEDQINVKDAKKTEELKEVKEEQKEINKEKVGIFEGNQIQAKQDDLIQEKKDDLIEDALQSKENEENLNIEEDDANKVEIHNVEEDNNNEYTDSTDGLDDLDKVNLDNLENSFNGLLDNIKDFQENNFSNENSDLLSLDFEGFKKMFLDDKKIFKTAPFKSLTVEDLTLLLAKIDLWYQKDDHAKMLKQFFSRVGFLVLMPSKDNLNELFPNNDSGKKRFDALARAQKFVFLKNLTYQKDWLKP